MRERTWTKRNILYQRIKHLIATWRSKEDAAEVLHEIYVEGRLFSETQMEIDRETWLMIGREMKWIEGD